MITRLISIILLSSSTLFAAQTQLPRLLSWPEVSTNFFKTNNFILIPFAISNSFGSNFLVRLGTDGIPVPVVAGANITFDGTTLSAAAGGGSTSGTPVYVNGDLLSAAAFNSTNPAAPAGATNYPIIFQVSGSNVTAYVSVPTNGVSGGTGSSNFFDSGYTVVAYNVTILTNFGAYNGNFSNTLTIAGIPVLTNPAAFQPAAAYLFTWAGINPTAKQPSATYLSNFATINTNYYVVTNATTDSLRTNTFLGTGRVLLESAAGGVPLPVSLANGGTGQSLSDPGANVVTGWDDTDNAISFLTLGSGLVYTHSTHSISVSASAGVDDTAYGSSWNGVTAIAPSKNAIYDYLHLFDPDDDGKVNVLDTTAGMIKTDSGGIVSVASPNTDYLPPANPTMTGLATMASIASSGTNVFTGVSNTFTGPIYNGSTNIAQEIAGKVTQSGLNSSTPAAPGGANNVTFQTSGANVSAYISTNIDQTFNTIRAQNGVLSNLTVNGSGTGAVVMYDADASNSARIQAADVTSGNINIVLPSSPGIGVLTTSQSTSNVYVAITPVLGMASGGTGQALSDPGANILYGWDDTDNAFTNFTIGSGLVYNHAAHSLSVSASAGIDDTAFAASWNGVTTIGPSKNAVYDYVHQFDTDDDGKVNVLDTTAGLVKTDASGIVSVAAAGSDYLAPGAVTSSGLTMSTAKILGRTTAGNGAIEELNATGSGNVVLSSSPTLSGTTLISSGGGLSIINAGLTNQPVTRINVALPPWSADRGGTNDATAAIQAAIEYSYTNGMGGIVYAPAGTYKITGTLYAHASTYIQGDASAAGSDSQSTRFYKGTSGNVIESQGDGVTLENLVLKSDGTANCGYWAGTNTNSRLVQVKASSFNIGFMLNYSWAITLDNCNAVFCNYGVILSNNVNGIRWRGGNISGNKIYGALIKGNSCYNNSFDCIIESNSYGVVATNNAYNIVLANCHFENNTNREVRADGIDKLNILNCGIGAKSGNGTNISLLGCYSPTIANNEFWNDTDDPITIDSNTTGWTVMGNRFYPNTSKRKYNIGNNDGFLADGGDIQLKSIQVASNLVYSISTAPATYIDLKVGLATNSVSGAVTLSYATNGSHAIGKPATIVFYNGSGSDQTLTIPAGGSTGWGTNAVSPVPTKLTNGWKTVMSVTALGPTDSAANQTNANVSFAFFKN